MSIPLIINGVTFQYPEQFDVNWGPTLTNWSSAVTSGMLQKAGGAFTLTAEVDFGSSFGIKVKSLKSEESNIAATGILRLANASAGVVWRNALNNADLPLTVNSSNQLTFNGINVGATTSLTQNHILVGNASNQPADVAMSGDIGIISNGVTAIAPNVIVNADISTGAEISMGKLEDLTAHRALATNVNGTIDATAVTDTEQGYLSGVTSAIQTQFNNITGTLLPGYLPLAGGTMTGVLNMGSHKIQSVTSGSATGEAITYRQIGEVVSGSTANSGGTAATIQQGTISTPDLRANAVTLTASSNSSDSAAVGTTITTASITTIGGKVLIIGSASLSGASGTILSKANGTGHMILDRGGTKIATSSASLIMNNSANTFSFTYPFSITYIDSPAAGSYTYTLSYTTGEGVSAVVDYKLDVVELRA